MHKSFVAGVLLTTLFASGCSTPMPNGDWIDFATLEPGKRPNRAFACTDDICLPGRATRPAIEVAAPAGDAAAAVQRMEPKAERRDLPSGDIRLRYVATTAVLKFKDDVDILVRPRSDERSTVAVFSRSRIGYSDFGTNRRRIDSLEERLKAELDKSQSPGG